MMKVCLLLVKSFKISNGRDCRSKTFLLRTAVLSRGYKTYGGSKGHKRTVRVGARQTRIQMSWLWAMVMEEPPASLFEGMAAKWSV